MLIAINRRRAQSTLEYAVLIAVAVGCFIAIQSYIKRGLEGKMRESTDDIGDQFSTSDGYSEVYDYSSDYDADETIVPEGVITTTVNTQQQLRENYEKSTEALADEPWPD